MNKLLVRIAAVLTVAAFLLATRSQSVSYVDAGGPKLRMLIKGSGSPTVVFETGFGASLELWGRVSSEVNKFAKTIVYDRAGAGLSEKARTPRDGRHVAEELHAALQNANAPPPYILVGESHGGPYARVFAGMYPDEVAGMVLVHPAQEEMAAWDQERDFGYPLRRQGECTSDTPLKCEAATYAQARENPIPGHVPVFLIHAAGPRILPFRSNELDEHRMQWIRGPAKLKFHKEWVDKVPGAQLIVTENSDGPMILFEEPELVIRTIRQVIDKANVR